MYERTPWACCTWRDGWQPLSLYAELRGAEAQALSPYHPHVGDVCGLSNQRGGWTVSQWKRWCIQTGRHIQASPPTGDFIQHI